MQNISFEHKNKNVNLLIFNTLRGNFLFYTRFKSLLNSIYIRFIANLNTSVS
jgi:hypothetical protein